MRYLFFFLSLLYSFIFYVFYVFSLNKDIFLNDLDAKKNILNLSLSNSVVFWNDSVFIIQSFFWNLLYEVIIFLFLWLILFFSFSKKDLESETGLDERPVSDSEKVQIFTFKNFVKVLKKFSYYVWFILFYLSFYLISLSFPIVSFSVFIFVVNIVIYILFFASKYNSVVRDFLRINSIIFSLFYLISYFYIITLDNNYFHLVDFINSFLILLIFPTILYFDKKISKKENFDSSLIVHFSAYIFWVFLFYFYFYIFHQNLVFWVSFISTFFGIIWFEILPKLEILKKSKIVLRYIWIIFSYIWILFWIIYLSFFDFSLIIFLILLLQSVYNAFIHRKYVNYISLFIWIFLLIYLFYYAIIYFNIIDYRSLGFLVLGFIISFLIIILTYAVKLKMFFSYYVIHFFSYLINIITIIIFFIFNNFDVLYIWILLLLESIYFFLSYYKLNPTKE